ncbi:hypothetical protein [Streptomyces sp. GQFP]|uniref:hypothetical protein n=1 Tax=Streptomyces sp. GQFP TaxID=2907545 RepID=UPI001F1640DF|nr:hypothetical protein [Streptomyces sp. GQFP]UIX32342.1 hypothetical protein LUX31_21130 [Streptomyces sp. GQFP]
MGGRPRDWHPVAEGDPIPGDPDQMASLGRKLRKTADELERQIKNIKAVTEVDAWDSKAGKEFRERAKGNVKKLEAAFKRYDTAADVIGVEVTEVGGGYQDKLHARPKNYASDLNRAQEIADAALKDARDADERKGAAQKSLDGFTSKKSEKDDSGGGDRKKAEAQRDAANDEIESAREKINEAKRVRDDAAERARESIEAVVDHDSLKDGFWETLVQTVADVTEFISTWAGILSLAVGWIPVIGQALAGALGAIAMIATLLNTLATLVQVFQGNAEWSDLATAALGFMMMGVGKAFSKVAGKFAKAAINRMSKAGVETTSKQIGRNQKKLNKIAGTKLTLSKKDILKSLKEPFAEPFSKSFWGSNLKALKPGSGSYSEAMNTIATRGGGSRLLGTGKSFSLADPGVASDLKTIKQASQGLDSFGAVNEISRKATRLSAIGTGITLTGLAVDNL